MRIVVTSNGTDLDAPASPVFGRCSTYVFVDTETMESEAIDNPAINAAGGAGIQAAQFVTERGAQAVVTGNMGPNAFNVFQSAGVPIYLFDGGTVRDAVEAFQAGNLQSIADSSARAGMGMGRGMGKGRGTGRGMGRRAAGPLNPAPPPSAPTGSQAGDIAALRDTANELRKQLAEVMDRLDRLEKEE
jgi:predicted Fe-Mo cluster-binding NifX family protein